MHLCASNGNISLSVQSFSAKIAAFRRLYIHGNAAIENQKAHLHRIRKNDKLTVPLFLDRLKQVNLLLAQFPNASEAGRFSPNEIKRIFYYEMPLRWRTNFINSGQSLHKSILEVVKTYMIHQEFQTDTHRRKSRDNNHKKQSSTKGPATSKSSTPSNSNAGNKKKNKEGKRK